MRDFLYLIEITLLKMHKNVQNSRFIGNLEKTSMIKLTINSNYYNLEIILIKIACMIKKFKITIHRQVLNTSLKLIRITKKKCF